MALWPKSLACSKGRRSSFWAKTSMPGLKSGRVHRETRIRLKASTRKARSREGVMGFSLSCAISCGSVTTRLILPMTVLRHW